MLVVVVEYSVEVPPSTTTRYEVAADADAEAVGAVQDRTIPPLPAAIVGAWFATLTLVGAVAFVTRVTELDAAEYPESPVASAGVPAVGVEPAALLA